MMRWAIVVICAGLCPAGGSAGDEIFQRDLSTPFLRDEDDRFNRDRDLPGPLRKTWPYTEGPERPFKAVEARRACHARAVFEMRAPDGVEPKALSRLQSKPDGRLLYVVTGQYQRAGDGAQTAANVICVVSSRQVVSFAVAD